MAMRAELKRPLGHLFRGQPAETVLKLKEFLKNRVTSLFAVVGDFTAENILAASLEPDIVVVDHRIMRITVDPLDHGTRRIINMENISITEPLQENDEVRVSIQVLATAFMIRQEKPAAAGKGKAPAPGKQRGRRGKREKRK